MTWADAAFYIVLCICFCVLMIVLVIAMHREHMAEIEKGPRDYSVPVPQWTQETTWTYTKDEPEEEDEGV